eukprot:1364347-Amorphochlora_amoeboformis.AAC.1
MVNSLLTNQPTTRCRIISFLIRRPDLNPKRYPSLTGSPNLITLNPNSHPKPKPKAQAVAVTRTRKP